MEPPQGLKKNLEKTYSALTDARLSQCRSKPAEYRKLVFCFCFFHAIILDRRKFGPIGWNKQYPFTDEDLNTSLKQLLPILNDYDKIPYDVINYLGGVINYGGRVTDDKDKRLLETVLLQYIRPEAMRENFKFCKGDDTYRQIEAETQEQYLEYIETLPLTPAPEVFGLHPNADISTAQSNTNSLLADLLSIQPKESSGGGKTREEVIIEIAKRLEDKMPEMFDWEATFKKYPTKYEESMNTCLIQEVEKYNHLMSIMNVQLKNVQLALVGEVVMSAELDALATALFNNQVPFEWNEKNGFLTLKPLATWFDDLLGRVEFIAKWIANGLPYVFWLNKFVFPQAFITGTKQNFARKYKVAIDELSFSFVIKDEWTNEMIEACNTRPEDGCYCVGLQMEGARWNFDTHAISPSLPKVLYSSFPMIQLLPVQNYKPPTTGIYNCPTYKVLSRWGQLSTTGHSTNFVIMIECPIAEDDVEERWTLAGVALFLALKF